MSAIPASSVNLKTMADGTLRVSFDIEPGQAQDAFRLFAAPGTQVAIAALMDGSYLAQQPIPPDSRELKAEPIGDCCRRAVMWCKEPSFWAWIRSLRDGRGFGACSSEASAQLFIQETCNVESRKELDTDNEANKAWHREIREPYRLWLQQQDQPRRTASGN